LQEPADPLAEASAAFAGTADAGPVGQPGQAFGLVTGDPAAHGDRFVVQ
jgi:hypothetical protein